MKRLLPPARHVLILSAVFKREPKSPCRFPANEISVLHVSALLNPEAGRKAVVFEPVIKFRVGSIRLGRREVGKVKRGSGLGTTLVLALVIVVLSVVLGVGLARYGGSLPLLGSLFGGGEAKTTTSPVVVEGIQRLDRLATVRWTESVVVTK